MTMSLKQVEQQPEIPFLLFELAEQLYGLPIDPVVQIIEMVMLKPLPQTPAFVKGIINYRGQIVPVLDLRLRFGLPAQSYTLHTPIILLRFDKHVLGLIVDDAHTVHFIPQENLSTSDAILPLKLTRTEAHTQQPHQLKRIARTDQHLILILDIETLLTESEQIALLQAMAAVNE